MMLYVAVEGRHPLRRATTLATLAAVLDEEIPPPVRAGALAPALNALLTRDIPARPDAETLDRLLAEAARGGGSTAPTPTEPVRERLASAHPASAHPASAHPGSVHAAPTQSAATPPPRPGPGFAPFGAPEDRVPTGYATPPPLPPPPRTSADAASSAASGGSAPRRPSSRPW